MEKNIPKMYKNKITKPIQNSQLIYSTMNKDNVDKQKKPTHRILDRFALEQKIYNILHSKNYIYKADVTIVTKDDILKKTIIAKSGNKLITFDNEHINIDDIIDIYQ